MTLVAYADGVCALRFALCRSSPNGYGRAPDAFPADGFEEVSSGVGELVLYPAVKCWKVPRLFRVVSRFWKKDITR